MLWFFISTDCQITASPISKECLVTEWAGTPHDAFEQFGAFSQDAIDNKALLAQGGRLTMPVRREGDPRNTLDAFEPVGGQPSSLAGYSTLRRRREPASTQ